MIWEYLTIEKRNADQFMTLKSRMQKQTPSSASQIKSARF